MRISSDLVRRAAERESLADDDEWIEQAGFAMAFGIALGVEHATSRPRRFRGRARCMKGEEQT